MTNEEFIQSIALPGEKWALAKGCDGRYAVSTYGRVAALSFLYYQGEYPCYRKQRIKHQSIQNGYYSTNIIKDGQATLYRVHRLVAEAFIPNPDNLPEVDHIDNNKANFDLSNLRWVTHRQNMNNEITKEICKTSVYSDESIRKRVLTSKGNGSTTSPKTTYQYDLDGHFVTEHISLNSAAKSVGVTSGAIRIVIDKDGRSSAGYLWRTYYSESINV